MDPGADDFPSLYKEHNGERYLTPTDLCARSSKPKRILLVGSCLAETWVPKSTCPCDFVLANNLSHLPEQPPNPIESYDLQIVQLSLRFIMTDNALWNASFLDELAPEQAFEEALQRLHQSLKVILGWNSTHNVLTFCSNFLVPQQNPMGRFAPRYDLRNPVYFVEQLNQYLVKELREYRNVFLLDVDGISSVFGKKNIQDDAMDILAHGSLLSNFAYERDMQRIEPVPRLTEHYAHFRDGYIAAVWRNVLAMYKTLNQEDGVKLVIVDLDNTLWRGVVAEGEEIDGQTNEGWPLGLMEALIYLKKRGIVLAIASQNEESKIRALWPQMMHGKVEIDDFAVVKINWRPKVENIEEILKVVNVAPRHTVFIDDSPVERSRVQSVFPEIRVLGKYPYYLRRVLLWSPETQVPWVTPESAKRSEMIQSQVVRETARQGMSRESFLATLAIELETSEMSSVDDEKFPRALELLNKTNQFNTTGKRWNREECDARFKQGTVFTVFHVKDRFASYGLVGCVVLSGEVIEQFVMSCRVIGMDVEDAVLSKILERIRANGGNVVTAKLVETKDNFPCRDLYLKCGFHQMGQLWQKSVAPEGVAQSPIN